LGLSKTWAVTIVLLLTFYTVGFSYITLGMPGTTVQHGMPVPVAWQDMGQHVETIEKVIEESTHSEPLIVGLDKYWISSQASFYDDQADDDEEVLPEFGAQGLFGRKGLMWDEWMPPEEARGRTVIVISFNKNDLKPTWVTHHFSRTSPIYEDDLHSGTHLVGRFYWRVGYDYQP
jgi:dolichol-phosphate mannosyltransferase